MKQAIEYNKSKKTQEVLAREHAELNAMIEGLPLAVLLVDKERRVRKANNTAEKIAGIRADKMLGRRSGEALQCLNSLDDPRGCGFGPSCRDCLIRRTIKNTFEKGRGFERMAAKFPVNHQGKKEELDVLISTSILHVMNEQLSLVCIEDVTERRRAEERILFASSHDALTGVYNRYHFEKQLEKFRKRVRYGGSVVMIDINDLKKTNDKLGHLAGDKIIRKIAKLLVAEFRETGVVARFGGDEFCILLPDTEIDEAMAIASRLQERIRKANRKNIGHRSLSISIGIAHARGGKDLDEAIKLADKKMYADKFAKKKIIRVR